MLMASNPKVIGKLHLPVYLRAVGWAAAGIMAHWLPSECFLLLGKNHLGLGSHGASNASAELPL